MYQQVNLFDVFVPSDKVDVGRVASNPLIEALLPSYLSILTGLNFLEYVKELILLEK
jgi:hypothetical protein